MRPRRHSGRVGIGSHGGHVYVSTDGGEHFENVSANLGRTPALWPLIYRGRLLVATTVGVYGKRLTAKGDYRLLGKTLPPAPVFSLAPWPGHERQILAASLGRGVYSFEFRR